MVNEIDIIDLTEEEYQRLTTIQLAMVRAAQAQKNEILAKAEEKKNETFCKLLSNNTARSSMRWELSAAIDADAERQVDVVREDLLYQLAYESAYADGNEQGAYSYPDNPNYNLSYEQRFLVVRDYYMHLSGGASARLLAFANDKLAVTYLGDYYLTLYNLLASYVS